MVKTHKLEAGMAEAKGDPEDLHEPIRAPFLEICELLAGFNELSGCGDQRNELIELLAEVIDLLVFNMEEIEELGLLGNADAVNVRYPLICDWKLMVLQDISLNILGIKFWC